LTSATQAVLEIRQVEEVEPGRVESGGAPQQREGTGPIPPLLAQTSAAHLHPGLTGTAPVELREGCLGKGLCPVNIS
jgi:hypothetical protein